MFETLVKYWRITVTLFVITLVAAILAFVKLPWTYQSSANVVLLPSKQAAKPYGGNPYLAFSYTLQQAANVLTFQAQDPGTVKALVEAGYTSSYVVTNAPGASAPVLLITVTGSDKDSVERTLTGVTKKIGSMLRDDQPDIDVANLIETKTVTFAPTPTRLSNKKARPLIVVLGGGVLLTVAIPSLLEFSSKRRTPRGKATAVSTGPDHNERPDSNGRQGSPDSGKAPAPYPTAAYSPGTSPATAQRPARRPEQPSHPEVKPYPGRPQQDDAGQYRNPAPNPGSAPPARR